MLRHSVFRLSRGCSGPTLTPLHLPSPTELLAYSIRNCSSIVGSSAGSSGSDSKPDQIILKGLVFHGYHGALKEENILGQKFVVDATLWADLSAAGRSDKLDDTIDYAHVYRLVQHVVEGPPRALQEAVAEQLCDELLKCDQRIAAVQVYIRKPHVALPGVMDSVGVQLMRRRHKPHSQC